MAQRSDASLIKHLTHDYGTETAKDWQRPPLVLLPDSGLIGYLLDMDMSADAEIHAPWSDVVFDFRASHGLFLASAVAKSKGVRISDATQRWLDGEAKGLTADGWWMRVRAFGPGDSGRTVSPWTLPLPQLDGPSYMIEAWTRHTLGGAIDDALMESLADRLSDDWRGAWLSLKGATGPVFPIHPTIGIVEPHGDIWQWRHGRCIFKGRCVRCDGDLKEHERWHEECVSRLAMRLLVYLTQCNEYLTEVIPVPKKPLPANRQKVHEAKPWLKEHLPHYILLDPTRAAEYGHPSARRPPEGHHASPHPHTRRGHWAVLRHEKFARNEDGSLKRVWRKQAWVGATEWTDGLDQRYRVVLPQQAT